MKRIKWILFWPVAVAILLIPARTVVEGLDLDEPVLPYRYAWVGPKDVPVYEVTGDPSQMTSVCRLERGTMRGPYQRRGASRPVYLVPHRRAGVRAVQRRVGGHSVHLWRGCDQQTAPRAPEVRAVRHRWNRRHVAGTGGMAGRGNGPSASFI